MALPLDRDGVPHIGGICANEAYAKENEADALANCGKEEDGKLVDNQVCLCDADLCNGANSVTVGSLSAAMVLFAAMVNGILQ